MPPRSSPSITSTTKRAKCLSGSHSSTDGGRRNAVRRSTSRKLLIAIKPPFGANQWRDSSENQRRWVKSDRLLGRGSSAFPALAAQALVFEGDEARAALALQAADDEMAAGQRLEMIGEGGVDRRAADRAENRRRLRGDFLAHHDPEAGGDLR